MKEAALRELLKELSLEEKIGQLVQLPGYFQNEGAVTGPAGNMGLNQEDLRLAGSYLSIIGAEKLKALQSAFMLQHPHHIPLLFMADIINGYRTVFPIPLAQGCSFDPALVEEGAAVAAREAAAAGIHVTFSPMADLVRDARWGRVMESTGEDPYLNGQMAAAMVRGYQGTQLQEPGKIAACLKHFAGYGAPEGGRDYNNVELSHRTLREDHLPAYQAAVDAGCELVMSSFNTLDRVPSAANEWLLKEVLRREMGFQGMVISDWNALQELLAHGIAVDQREAAFIALRAGVDMDMTSPIYTHSLKQLVEEGKVPEAWIDESAWRVLRLKNRLGLFEHPFKDADEAEEKRVLLSAEHRQAARACAEKSFVLLKNEGRLLPLQAEETVFIGPYVNNPYLNGAWSIFADDRDTVTLGASLRMHPRTKQARTAPGCAICDPEQPVMGFQRPIPAEALDSETALAEAVALAKSAKTVVLCLGEHRECTGEAASRGGLGLPACQLRLLNAVAEVNPNVAVALFGGRPLDIRPLAEKAKAILVCWLPGTEGGPAVLRTLLGESNPSGRLSMCFPLLRGTAAHPLQPSEHRPAVPRRSSSRALRLQIPGHPQRAAVPLRLWPELHLVCLLAGEAQRRPHDPPGGPHRLRHHHKHGRLCRHGDGAAVHPRPGRQRRAAGAVAERLPEGDAAARGVQGGVLCGDGGDAALLRSLHALCQRTRGVRAVHRPGQPDGKQRTLRPGGWGVIPASKKTAASLERGFGRKAPAGRK